MTQPTPAAPAEPAAPAPQADTPPWGTAEDFNPEKAWSLIQNLRGDNEKLKTRPVLDETAQQRLAEYDRLVEASKTDLERAKESETRWQSEAEKWRTKSVSSHIQALAATDFADPTDAVNALDPTKYLDAGGEINTDQIRKDLAALLEAKPHYKRPDGAAQPRVPAPNAAQGASGAPAADPRQQFAAILGQQLA